MATKILSLAIRYRQVSLREKQSVKNPFIPANTISYQAGFTLLELMITVTIVGILSTIAFPSYKSIISSNRITAGTNQMVTALNLARSEAVKRGQYVVVRRTGTDWEGGWQVFVDSVRDTASKENVLDAGDTTLRTFSSLPGSLTLRGSTNFADYVNYSPTGISQAQGVFAICDSGAIAGAKLILINVIGRVRMGTDTDNDRIPEEEDGTEITSCTSNL